VGGGETTKSERTCGGIWGGGGRFLKFAKLLVSVLNMSFLVAYRVLKFLETLSVQNLSKHPVFIIILHFSAVNIYLSMHQLITTNTLCFKII
jgi:hypothetical protein